MKKEKLVNFVVTSIMWEKPVYRICIKGRGIGKTILSKKISPAIIVDGRYMCPQCHEQIDRAVWKLLSLKSVSTLIIVTNTIEDRNWIIDTLSDAKELYDLGVLSSIVQRRDVEYQKTDVVTTASTIRADKLKHSTKEIQNETKKHFLTEVEVLRDEFENRDNCTLPKHMYALYKTLEYYEGVIKEMGWGQDGK